MQFYVVGPNGEKFGPAEEALLAQWAAQGRITAYTQLENAVTGERVAAASIPGIISPAPPYGYDAPPYGTVPPYASGGSTLGGLDSAASAHAAPYPVPDAQLAGWNWGAFVFNWIWGLNHKAYLTLLAFIPYVGFAVAIWSGIQGNKWAWESGRFATVEEMRACQAVWRTWAIAWLVLGVLIGLAAVFLPLIFSVSSTVTH